MSELFGYKTLFAAATIMVAVLYGFSAWTSSPAPTQLPAAATEWGEVHPYQPVELSYIEVTEGCGPYHEGACVNARSGPGVEYPAVWQLRNGIVLETSGSIEAEGRTWYKLAFNEWLRFPERIEGDLYVAADFVTPFKRTGPEELLPDERPVTAKSILIDRSDQKLYAYNGNELFMEQLVSTGLELTPTPRGNFVVFKKTPSRYMQGPVADISDDVYDLPGVPWNLYFTEQGGAIHGAYWHDHFGMQWSHGCVNVALDKARELYEWADLGTPVTVRD